MAGLGDDAVEVEGLAAAGLDAGDAERQGLVVPQAVRTAMTPTARVAATGSRGVASIPWVSSFVVLTRSPGHVPFRRLLTTTDPRESARCKESNPNKASESVRRQER